MTPRTAARIDINQPQIVYELRQLGYSVACIHQLGHGLPDILVGSRGVNLLFQIKQPGMEDQLTPDEKEWHASWNGQVHVIACAEDALDIIELLGG